MRENCTTTMPWRSSEREASSLNYIKTLLFPLCMHNNFQDNWYKTDQSSWSSQYKKKARNNSTNEYLISVIHAHGDTSSPCKLKHLSGQLFTPISRSVGDFKHSWSIYNKISCTILEAKREFQSSHTAK